MMKSNDHDEENGNRRDVPFPAISAATLASLLGVTPKTVYELTKAGVLQREAGRLSRWRIACAGTAITFAEWRKGNGHDFRSDELRAAFL